MDIKKHRCLGVEPGAARVEGLKPNPLRHGAPFTVSSLPMLSFEKTFSSLLAYCAPALSLSHLAELKVLSQLV